MSGGIGETGSSGGIGGATGSGIGGSLTAEMVAFLGFGMLAS
jgi:hypothetical protein